MNAWVQDRFSDAERALTTIVVSADVLGTSGFLLVADAVLAAR